MKPILNIENLTKIYGNVPSQTKALNGITFQVMPGEFLGIMGSSGSGKSTLMKLLLKEVEPSSGKIIVNDMELGKMPRRYVPKYRRRLGVVFQDFRLLKDKTVYENVAFAQRVIGVPTRTIKESVPEMLRLVGLSSKYKSFPNQLSGGEQQRIAIARVMLKNAPIIILDEATAFADPENEHLIQQALKELTKGKTVLMIAHRLSSITDADNILVIDKGKIAEQGTHANLLGKQGIYYHMWNEYQQSVRWTIGKEVSND